ncbi:MAG TPA: ComEC/Rec2 family competence protein [Chthoniobacterales bacterium]
MSAAVFQPVGWWRQRFPCLGLFLAACTGVCAGDARPDLWPLWAVGFVTLALQAAIWRRTVPVLLAVAAFAGFWQGWRIVGDKGYQFAVHLAPTPHVHVVKCRIEDEPRAGEWRRRPEERFTARVGSIDGFAADFRALFMVPGTDLHQGDQFQVTGRFSRPELPRNPGEMDWRDYYGRRGLYLRISAFAPPTLIARAAPFSFRRLLREFRARLDHNLQLGIEDDPETCQVLRAMVFGDRTGMDPGLLDLLERTGTLHLFVVDGLKVTFVAGLGWFLTRLLPVGRRTTALVVCLVLTVYGVLTGFSPSGLRASGMCLLVVAGVMLERPAFVLNALGATGFGLILLNPQYVYETGFQLSFSVVAAIAVAVRPLGHFLARGLAIDPFLPVRLISPWRRHWLRFGRHACELTAVSVVCWAASLPVSVLQFHRVSLSGVALNVVAVPLGSAMLVTGVAAIPAGFAAARVAGWLNNCNFLLSKVFLGLLRASTVLPADAVNLSLTPPPPAMCALLATGRKPVLCVHDHGKNWLFDLETASQWKAVVLPYLRYRGINSLQGIFLAATADDPPLWPGLVRDYRCPLVASWREALSSPEITSRLAPAGSHTTSPVLQLGHEAFLQTPERSGSPPRRSSSRGWLVFELAGFRLGWTDSVSAVAIGSPPPALDVLILPRAAFPGGKTLLARTGARLAVSVEGHSTGWEVNPVPTFHFAETGEIEFAATPDLLTVHTFRDGHNLVLVRRSR